MDEFGIQVKTALLRIGKTQQWLVERLHEKTGLYMDSAYLSRILRGVPRSQTIVDAIREILNLKE